MEEKVGSTLGRAKSMEGGEELMGKIGRQAFVCLFVRSFVRSFVTMEISKEIGVGGSEYRVFLSTIVFLISFDTI